MARYPAERVGGLMTCETMVFMIVVENTDAALMQCYPLRRLYRRPIYI